MQRPSNRMAGLPVHDKANTSSQMQEVRTAKLRRISSGGSIRVLDLFGGCGGLSLGFHAAGFEIAGQVEIDPFAARSHSLNFCRSMPESQRAAHAVARDITRTEPEDLLRALDLEGKPEETIDVIVGGPPCQAFARVGRAKLREVAEHPKAFKQDPRANLYLRFLYYVERFQPIAILMENVPDVINFGGHNIPNETCEVLEEMGYDARYTLLNAAFFGVPQMRERMFLLAYTRQLRAEVRFPRPTHWMQLPKGYEGTRSVALRHLQDDLFGTEPYFVPLPTAKRGLPSAVTAEEALRDLPPITAHLEGKLRRGTRRFDHLARYSTGIKPSPYARKMRTWRGFESKDGVFDHVIRSLPRDYAIFRRMRPGDQYPEAHTLALKMFEEKLDELEKSGVRIRPGTADYRNLQKQIVPPYDPGKFPNKWRKMEPDLPARTLMAHLGKDSYSHIHFDSDQARTISVREAARLQSFPDGFVFAGTMNPAFRQIGNAVPPLLANAIAKEVRKAILNEAETLHQTADILGSDIVRVALP